MLVNIAICNCENIEANAMPLYICVELKFHI